MIYNPSESAGGAGGNTLEAIKDKINADRFKDAIYVFADSEDEDSAYF